MTITQDDREMAANLAYRIVAAVHADQDGRKHHPDAIEMTVIVAEALANERATERRRWLNWLADIGYGQDFAHDDPPPCTPRDLAEVLNERENLDADADGGQTGVDLWVWVIAENSGWELCGNCGGNPHICDCDES